MGTLRAQAPRGFSRFELSTHRPSPLCRWTDRSSGPFPARATCTTPIGHRGKIESPSRKVTSRREILTIEPDGTNQQVVSPVPQDLDIFNEHASWSPDAGQIAFEHNPESHCTEISPGQFECKNNAQIYTVEADGNGLTELTAYDPNRTDENPGWSPDGSQIAFARYDFSGPSPVNPTIQLMDTDGGNVHEIASGAGPERQPLVAPRTSHRPRILGVPRSGQELVAKPGSWFGTPDLSFTYQWRRCSSGTVRRHRRRN